MSISSIVSIKHRIKKAWPDSPIAVFVVKIKGDNPRYALDAMFANTIDTQRKITYFPDNYVGSFHGQNFDSNRLETVFRKALAQARNNA